MYPSEENVYRKDHDKSMNTVFLWMFQFINDLMTLGMAGIVVVAS